MANAGCINAYDCNGCLIQTLQNLDSACIGVGVQYTAPNPLDDKRLDYIKYTDKCGCVQCLSAENEILIYATNGVIKNLTLTNDDVNEAIKIKWNDIFGSNRAKTIVRYKTGSAPVSITDGTLAVEETVKNQYSSTPFSLSGVLDETTYYISAFAVDSNGTIIDVQTNSIKTDFIFGGYQKVEYIGSSGNDTVGQYINTGIKKQSGISLKVEADVYWFSQTADCGIIYGIYDSSVSGVTNSYHFGFQKSISSLFNKIDGTEGYATWNPNYYSTNTRYKIISSGTSNRSSNLSMFLLAQNEVGSPKWCLNGRLYYCKIWSGGTLVRDFYPVYRKSDNVIGLLDIVNKQFYTNSGSGSFTKGPNVN